MRAIAFVLALSLVVWNTSALAANEDTRVPSFEETKHLAEQGNVDAQFNLGWMYRIGQGVPKNDAEAVAWYRRAAEQGDASAQYNLGVTYQRGEGIPKNDAEAVAWYRRAAEQGDAKAQHNLGVMYDEGEGVPKNDVDAYFWFNLAAAQGQENAGGNRDSTEKQMTREQIAEAQRRSATWKPKTE
ncbi:MAG: sel1 repeat family protein [Gammaproteobacteria bacterium]|nr:sel1 repeat family protein [Gammaproteobacteria bacterium]